MAEYKVHTPSDVLGLGLGLVELPPGKVVQLPTGDVGRWVIPSYLLDYVDGCFVPVHHVGLYTRILERHGHLASGPIIQRMPQLVLLVVSQTLDMIAEIENARDTELSRERVGGWLAMVRFSKMVGLSVGWLESLVEELDSMMELEEVTSKIEWLLTFKVKIDSEKEPDAH